MALWAASQRMYLSRPMFLLLNLLCQLYTLDTDTTTSTGEDHPIACL